MGQRSRTETVAAVFVALLGRRLWSQAELAREVDVRPEALRKLLGELAASGVPLTSERQHPHVYWRVPATWFPGGILFKREDVPDLVRQLRRLPRSKVRERLLDVVAQQLTARSTPAETPVVAPRTNDMEELYASIVEDAAARRVALAMRYLTASRSESSQRHASVHLVEVGPPMRFIATCHRHGALRTFRVDAIITARLDEREPFRGELAGDLDAYRAGSLDGFRGEGEPAVHSFFVRRPESNWVANNLLDGMQSDVVRDGIRVNVKTSALVRLARFVVALGDAAQAEDSALRKAVWNLALGALENARDAAGMAQLPLVDPITAQPLSDV